MNETEDAGKIVARLLAQRDAVLELSRKIDKILGKAFDYQDYAQGVEADRRADAAATAIRQAGESDELDHRTTCESEAVAALREAGLATARALARAILDSGRVAFATAHVSGVRDEATARHNITDAAEGRPAKRSDYGDALGGSVQLREDMLSALLRLSRNYTITVSELVGGWHSANSRHYFGATFDINVINGQHVSSRHPGVGELMKRCRDLGATEVLGPGDDGHSTHVHAAWPREVTRVSTDPENEGDSNVAATLDLIDEVDGALGALATAIETVAETLEQRANRHGRFRTGAFTAPQSDEDILLSLAPEHGLGLPVRRLIDYRNANRPTSRPRYWAIVNFNLHSKYERLYVFDVMDRDVTSYLCAHGIGSEGPGGDDGFATDFSNVPGSKKSSLGIYHCSEEYQGSHGRSMRLDGLESSNSNARARAVVLHPAAYVSQEIVDDTGRIGRSEGCFVVEYQYRDTVIDELKDGSLLLAYKS